MVMIDPNRTGRLLLFLILLLGVVIRINPFNHIINVDEVIPLNVIAGMKARGDYNTDFSLGIGMPEYFRQYGYAFSGYIIVSKILLGLFHLRNHLFELRFINIVYFICSYMLFFLLLKRLLIRWGVCGKSYLVLGMLLFTVLPGPVFDAWMARPDCLLALLLVCSIYLIAGEADKLYNYAIAGFVVGLGISIKITFIFLVPFVLIYLYLNKYYSARSVLLFLLFLPLGFVFGCPYAFLYPDIYYRSQLALMTQYHSPHPPHSLISTDPLRMLTLQGEYFILVYGSMFILPFIALVYCFFVDSSRWRVVLPLALLFVLLFVYFGTRLVFFERNTHIYIVAAVPVFILVMSELKYSYIRFGVYLLALMPMAFWVYSMFASYQVEGKRKLLAPGFKDVPYSAYFLPYVVSSGRLRLIDYSDDYSERYRDLLKENGYRVTVVDKGPFAVLPVNTYLTYLSPNYYYMEKFR